MADGEQCCCFCLNLRSGSYMSAGYSIALGAISLILSILIGIAGGTSPTGIFGWIIAVIFLLWIIFAIILIVGVQKNSRGYLIPWVVITIILSVFVAISIIISLVGARTTFRNTSLIINFIINVAILVLNCYALWCVLSLHKRNMAP